MTALVARRFIVSGRVQGVYFRASTRQQAVQLNIRGYARNLPDGNVEVLAIGHADAVAALEKWLWQGPPSARVTAVAGHDHDHDDLEHHTAFNTL
ncbi:MAG: acylphosphatase [Steroidobacter sp.]